jgi:hypothetical protein
MDPAAVRRHGHERVDWIADYLEYPEQYLVLARVKPESLMFVVKVLPAGRM